MRVGNVSKDFTINNMKKKAGLKIKRSCKLFFLLILTLLLLITGINKLKTLTKYKSCQCKCRFDGKKFNSDQWRNSNKH